MQCGIWDWLRTASGLTAIDSLNEAPHPILPQIARESYRGESKQAMRFYTGWVIRDGILRAPARPDVRLFSNRPFRVKHFQTIRRCSVDVAHGLALLFGIGAKALPLWDSRMRWSNLCSGLAVRRNGRSKRTCELTSSIVPRGTSSTARWSSSFLLLDLIL